ncbi:hypothetical protein AAG592_03300 [Citromicrobium bathyomarinum]|uniref:hypothetical protein n=1 Tax=Citromicrobium bathyomarinum TaxID=72174 RepID=UPI0031599881
MGRISQFSLACAAAAMAATPVAAAELPHRAAPAPAYYPHASQTVLNHGGDEASQYRRYRYHRRHRDRIDAGDIIAGAVIIGGIFAIASAASKNSNRNDRYDDDYVNSSDFDRAVDSCVNRVERDRRIGSVDNVGRTRSGYSVSGTLSNGSGFLCEVNGAGRVLRVDYGYSGVTYQSGGDTYGDPQYSDETYARARASTYSSPDSYSSQDGYASPDSSAQPAYPGGPLPGEDGYGDTYDGSYGDDYEGEPY